MPEEKGIETIDSYEIRLGNLITRVDIFLKEEDFVPNYHISISNISQTTKIILEKIRKEFISKVNVEMEDVTTEEGVDLIRKKFEKEIEMLISKYFTNLDQATKDVLISYVIRQNLGLGDVEILLKDANLEELVINNSKESVWVYHKKHGWLKTNVLLPTEARIRHYSTMIGRDVGKEITLLNPLMDAHLRTGDRVNATLHPISDFGNTITIRKFAEKPWTITDFIAAGTISFEAAAFIWLGIQNEFSTLIAGGTGSGKTSTLNVISNFFPPNQRIISIEDTRELTLPKQLHWVPMTTRMPNPEGKGGVSMLDLVVNALRQRPDRILVGEIRRQKEAEVLFEAMHTGHSVYATIHANNAKETVDRLTNPPINIPKTVISALGILMVQNRNRRTGKRRTLQLAEIKDNGDPEVIMQLDVHSDQLKKLKMPKKTFETLNLYTGLTEKEINKDLGEKIAVLQALVKMKITNVHDIGHIMARYYTNKLDIRKDIMNR
ncbi:MAG: Flp pilus assembly complex ATPase component TadA [Nanoarchaeota archaeon]|nr:Flp pilus assembly complex ATPase component TadA [Nanoarchaeota archaeon]